MKVAVQFFGDLRKYLRQGQEVINVDIEAGGTIGGLLQRLGVEKGEVWVVSLNDSIVDEMSQLVEGGKVLVFPPFEGG